jgi:hypothetical protein
VLGQRVPGAGAQAGVDPRRHLPPPPLPPDPAQQRPPATAPDLPPPRTPTGRR